MSEIKFRVWDKSSKRFTKNLVINWDGSLKAKRLDDSLTRADKAERFDVQFYTGLKDKNGKEIYEGDIVRDYAVGAHVREVIFHKGTFCYKVAPHSYHIFNEKQLEVIGNIYENPELLKYPRAKQSRKKV